MWGSSEGGIRERKVAKAAMRKPIRPRRREVNEVKDVKDLEAELSAELGRVVVIAVELVWN